jgi:predicted naringenin-chalcone synthase
MKAIRNLYYIGSFLLPIAYLTLAMDHGNIESFVLWSSIIMTVVGIFMIVTYDGPAVSDLRATLLGRPPVMARVMVFIYGCVAAFMAFHALGLSQLFR